MPATDRDDVRRPAFEPPSDHRDFSHDGIAAPSESLSHQPSAIILRDVVGQRFSRGTPVTGHEVRLKALAYPACRVFQPRRPTQLFELRDRGVQVRFVEDLSAVDQFAFDSHKYDDSPLSVEALSRGSLRHLDEDRSEAVQPMHCLDEGTWVFLAPYVTEVCGQIAGGKGDSAPVIQVDPVRCCRWQLVPDERLISADDDRPCVRVGRRFAGEVVGIELGDGGVEVVEVEYDSGHHHPVGVDLIDFQRFYAERIWPRVLLLESHVAEAETIASQSDRRVRDARAHGRDRTDVR